MKQSIGTVNSFNDKILPSCCGKLFVVSGADGFLGARLTKTLLAAGARVFALVRSGQALKRLDSNMPGLSLAGLDLSNADVARVTAQLPKGIDAVIHAAAVGINPGPDDWDHLLQVNVQGTKAMLDLAVAVGARRFVYIGSSFEYGDGNNWQEEAPAAPLNLYGVSKNMGWALTQHYGRARHLNIVGIRPFYMYGPGEAAYRLVPLVIAAIKNGTPLRMTLGEQERDFIYIDDAVQGIVAASIKEEAIGGLFNICTGTPVTIRRAVEELVRISGCAVDVQFGALAYRQKEWWHLSGSPQKAAKILNFKADIDLNEGLKKALASHP